MPTTPAPTRHQNTHNVDWEMAATVLEAAMHPTAGIVVAGLTVATANYRN